MFHFVPLPKIRMMLPQVIACAEGAVITGIGAFGPARAELQNIELTRLCQRVSGPFYNPLPSGRLNQSPVGVIHVGLMRRTGSWHVRCASDSSRNCALQRFEESGKTGRERMQQTRVVTR
jgi:hypothetical protein